MVVQALSPWACSGGFQFTRAPWGKCLLDVDPSTQHQQRAAAEGCIATVWATTFGLVLCLVLKRKSRLPRQGYDTVLLAVVVVHFPLAGLNVLWGFPSLGARGVSASPKNKSKNKLAQSSN